ANSTTLSLTLTGLEDAIALAIDARGDVYVANFQNNSVSEFLPGQTAPNSTFFVDLNGPSALAFDAGGNLYVANGSGNTVSVFSAPPPVASAGGGALRPAQPGESVNVGASFGFGLILSDDELAQLFTTAGGAVTIGDSSNTGDILVTGPVNRH